MAVGIVLKSTELSAPVPEATIRRPFKSTNVRGEPKPRNETRIAPEPPLLIAVLVAAPATDGISCKISPILEIPDATRS